MREGMWLAVGEFVEPLAGEEVLTQDRPFPHGGRRELHRGGLVESAATIEAIIDEVAIANVSERGATRGDDKFSETAMEDRKREGYF
jgi:sulfate adenylyltransferase subunit 2